jgi:hypothetical protein
MIATWMSRCGRKRLCIDQLETFGTLTLLSEMMLELDRFKHSSIVAGAVPAVGGIVLNDATLNNFADAVKLFYTGNPTAQDMQ